MNTLLSIIRENTRYRGDPLGLRIRFDKWAEGITLPQKGETVLYTGCLYQMSPYISSMRSYLATLEGRKKLSKVAFSLLRSTRKFGLDVLSLAVKPAEATISRYNGIIRKLALLLKKAGVAFAHIPNELYSGVMLYDLGLDEEFTMQAEKVSYLLKTRGVKKVITIDPHTTYALREVYPKYVDGFDIQVSHYIEVLNPSNVPYTLTELASYAIHEPCYLTRYIDLTSKLRNVVSGIKGLRVEYPRSSGRMTNCCGGPVEALIPSLAEAVAGKRVEELALTGSQGILVFCPICLANLEEPAQRLGLKVVDLAEVWGETAKV